MSKPTYDERLKQVFNCLAYKNEKPISCFSGSAPGAVIMGMTVAEYLDDPVKGTMAGIAMLRRLEGEAGPLGCLNSSPKGTNNAVNISLLWNSKVLIPGKDLPENSSWQVQEKQLIDTSAYDEILSGGYTNFVKNKILPRILDMDYVTKYRKIATEGEPEITKAYSELGVPRLATGTGLVIPFEQLCGMRSMSQFYMDCYKIPDKLKELSDFVFAEMYAQKETELEKVRDNPTVLGGWVGGWRTASALVNQKIWDNLVWPYLKPAAEQMIKFGKIPIMHLDQDWGRDIERFGELPAGKIILHTDGMTNLPRTRKLLPGYALMGDVPPTLLTTGTPQQVSVYVKKLIDEVGPQGLFVCPGCDAPITSKFENIVAMVKTTNEWH